MSNRDFYDDDDTGNPGKRKFTEFDCPDCNANNPLDDGFRFGDVVLCFYCGSHFKVRDSGGKPRFVEV